MSLLIYPVFNPDVPDVECEYTGEILGNEFEALDELALEFELTSILEYGDNRPLPEDFEGDADEVAEVLGPREDWYDCTTGKKTCEALASLIESDPAAAEALEDPEGVAAELRDIARALAVAASKGAKFRLELS